MGMEGRGSWRRLTLMRGWASIDSVSTSTSSHPSVEFQLWPCNPHAYWWSGNAGHSKIDMRMDRCLGEEYWPVEGGETGISLPWWWSFHFDGNKILAIDSLPLNSSRKLSMTVSRPVVWSMNQGRSWVWALKGWQTFGTLQVWQAHLIMLLE